MADSVGRPVSPTRRKAGFADSAKSQFAHRGRSVYLTGMSTITAAILAERIERERDHALPGRQHLVDVQACRALTRLICTERRVIHQRRRRAAISVRLPGGHRR